MKRYIYVIVGIIVVAAIAILLIFLLKQRSTSTGTTGTTGSLPSTGTQGIGANGSQGGTPGSSSSENNSTSSSTTTGQTSLQSLTIFSPGPVLDYFVDNENNITTIAPDGTITSISNGQSTELNSAQIEDIISASFSYDGKKILVNFGDPNNPQSSVFDIATKSWLPLSQGLFSPVWSPLDYRIAYFTTPSTGELTLSTLDVSSVKNHPTALATLNANDMDLQWINKNQLVLYDKPSLYLAGSAWLFSLQTKSIYPIVSQVKGLEADWNSTTASSSIFGLIFSTGESGDGGAMQLINSSGNVFNTITFLSLPSKCVFNAQVSSASTTASTYSLILYCAVPRDQSTLSSAALPDAYNEMALFTSDDIYEINTVTGETQTLWDYQAQNVDASDVKIFNETLFFVSRYDKKLYGLSLPQ